MHSELVVLCCCVKVVLLCCCASMLDDFTHEVDNTHSKLDNVMKKLAKVSHMTSGTAPRVQQEY